MVSSKKRVLEYAALVLLFLLPIVNAQKFIADFDEDRHVYDYADIFANDEQLEKSLAGITEKRRVSIYYVTLPRNATVSQVDQLRNIFNFSREPYGQQTTSTIPGQPSPTPPPSSPNIPERNQGTILSYMDVADWHMFPSNSRFTEQELATAKFWFVETGYEPCWPLPKPTEPDWKALWQEHACMTLPENFDFIIVKSEWLNEPAGSRYVVSIKTNALLGKEYKEGGYWMFEDRDGHTYKLAPLDLNDDFYQTYYSDYLERYKSDPNYIIDTAMISTETAILWEKYRAIVRVSHDGSSGYPIPPCETERVPLQVIGSVAPGDTLPLPNPLTTTTIPQSTPTTIPGITTTTVAQSASTTTIPVTTTTSPGAEPYAIHGTILSYMDVGDYDNTGKNRFEFSDSICWPSRAPDERDWRAAWNSYAETSYPEYAYMAKLPLKWFFEPDTEGYYVIQPKENVLLGKEYKEGGYWMFEDRDGYNYKLAPLNENDAFYEPIKQKLPGTDCVDYVERMTLMAIVEEKYSARTRVSNDGSDGYPLPECEGNIQSFGDEGPGGPIVTGYTTSDEPCNKLLVFGNLESCPKCVDLEPHIDRLEQEYSNLVIERHEDWQAEPTLFDHYSAYPWPTLIYFDSSGEEHRHTGYMDYEELVAWLRSLGAISSDSGPSSVPSTTSVSVVTSSITTTSLRSYPTTTYSTSTVPRATTTVHPSKPADVENCKIVVVYWQANELNLGYSHCPNFHPDNVLGLSYIQQKFKNIIRLYNANAGVTDIRQSERGLFSSILTEILRYFPRKPSVTTSSTPGQVTVEACQEQFDSAMQIYNKGNYEEAFDAFSEIVSTCGDYYERARYQMAYIRYVQQRYSEAAGLAEQAFQIANLREIKRGSLRIAILSYKELGRCTDVMRLASSWNYGSNTEVQQAIEECREQPIQPSPPSHMPGMVPGYFPPGTENFKADVLLHYEFLQKKFAEQDYYYVCKSSPSLQVSYIIEAFRVDRNIAKGMLEILLKCLAITNQCDLAENAYVFYSQEFGASQELNSAVSHCVPPSNKPTIPLSVFSIRFPFCNIPSSDNDKERIISSKVACGWDAYNRGDYKTAKEIALSVNSDYFVKQVNALFYPELFRSTKKLIILAQFKIEETKPLTSRNCNDIGESYYLANYQLVFGTDEDIEAVWNECEGKQHIKLTGSRCSSSWPTGEGSKVGLNTVIDSCELFETGNQELEYVIEDARNCCSGSSDGSALCRFAKAHSTLSDAAANLKRCMGIYIIKAIGEYAKYIQNYFEPETNCEDGFKSNTQDNPYAGRCSSEDVSLFDSFAKSLPCRSDHSIIWESDTDPLKNNCRLVEPPAHATLNILKTGTCADYSVITTTLLRMAGYQPDEVFSVDQTIHATNLVKLPGEAKYHHVDTTNNKVGIVFDGTFPSTKDWNKVGRWSCMNDKGRFPCPDNSIIIESFG